MNPLHHVMYVFSQLQIFGLPALANLYDLTLPVVTQHVHMESLPYRRFSSETLSFNSAIRTGLNLKMRQMLLPRTCSAC